MARKGFKIKIANEVVTSIYYQIKFGEDIKEVADEYNVSYSTARRIAKKEGRYKDIIEQAEQAEQSESFWKVSDNILEPETETETFIYDIKSKNKIDFDNSSYRIIEDKIIVFLKLLQEKGESKYKINSPKKIKKMMSVKNDDERIVILQLEN